MNAPVLRERRFERAGLLALDPQAFLSLFLLGDPPTDNTMIGDVEVVDVRGPLEQHAGGWCDSYEAVRGRVQCACESQSRAVVLRIDSPGGAVAGAFSTAREIRAMAQAAGKPLWAFVEGKAHSAGYALACAAERILITDTATVGSVGVINTRPDYSAADARDGLRYAVTASGARKADGHPHVAVTEGELKAAQRIVDEMAGVFFELVGEMRGLTPDAVQGTEAGVFTGQGAIAAGLADEVGTFDGVVAAIVAAKETETMSAKTLQQTTRAGDYEDARSALERAAKGEGKQAEGAKRALAALDAKDDDKAEGDDDKDDKSKDDDKAEGDDDKDDKSKDDDKAEGDDDKDDKSKDDDKAEGDDDKDDKSKDDKSARSASGNPFEARLAKLETRYEDADRTALLATRPDIPQSLSKVLANKPLSVVREILDATPRQAAPKPAAAASTTGTRGEGQGDPAPSAEANELDLRMGLVPHKVGVKREGNVMRFGVMQASPKAPPAAAK